MNKLTLVLSWKDSIYTTSPSMEYAHVILYHFMDSSSQSLTSRMSDEFSTGTRNGSINPPCLETVLKVPSETPRQRFSQITANKRNFTNFHDQTRLFLNPFSPESICSTQFKELTKSTSPRWGCRVFEKSKPFSDGRITKNILIGIKIKRWINEITRKKHKHAISHTRRMY